MNPRVKKQSARSLATQQALREAAEKLIARKGIQNVSIKSIVEEAGQKNESALQYHFKNLKGLMDAIHATRTLQTRQKRAELLAELLAELDKNELDPTLRELCKLMVSPSYLLAKSDPKYRRFVTSFSHELALTENSALTRVYNHGGGGESGKRTGKLLRSALPHLNEATYRMRMDIAVRTTAIAMGHHARQKNAFRGIESERFLSHLVDAITGILSAPVSDETRTYED
ncbi:MAG: AcrR family transcriptional regulator [Candidatus Azotimanducaceae bacterium]